MKVLIVDDTDYKTESLRAFLKDCGCASEVQVAKCFQTALRALKEFQPTLVLLDMSLPTSQRSDGELEGRDRIYGGKQLLAEMEFEDLTATVIIVTQYDHFGEGPNAINLNSLLGQLQKRFPTLVAGGVYYSNVDSLWRDKLRTILRTNKFLTT
jgi:CheY-like chemotaxis protein